jgi:hypothetical protein
MSWFVLMRPVGGIRREMPGRVESASVRADWRGSTDCAILDIDLPDINLNAADPMIPGEIADASDAIKNKLPGWSFADQREPA